MIPSQSPIQIHLSFLMVGHTHEDVDQVFSRISAYLSRLYPIRYNIIYIHVA